MKKLTLQIATVVLLAVTVTISSCSKEGPMGATGPQGPTGPAGAQGASGPQGEPGTANVIYSEWLDVTFEPATDNNSGDTVIWFAEIPAPQLDVAMLTNGEIKVYFNGGAPDDPAVFPLPLFDAYALTGVQNINVYFTNGFITLYSTDDASTFTDQGVKVWQYRYILIPGETAAGRKKATIDWNDYNAVKKYLNLKD